MSAILKWFPKKKTITFFWSKNYLNYTKRPNFACGNYIFPETRGSKYKPWTHSTPLNITDSIGLMEIEACILNSQFSIIQLFYLKKQTNKQKKKPSFKMATTIYQNWT